MLVDTLQTTQENCMAFVQNINFLLLTLTPNYLDELTYKSMGRPSSPKNEFEQLLAKMVKEQIPLI